MCFGCAGASIAIRNRLNYLAVVFSAFFASTGGGTIRDVALHNDAVFWLDDPSYLLAILIAIVIAKLHGQKARISRILIRLISSLGTSVFVMVGVLAALEANCNTVVVLLSGVLTGIGGGMLRQAVFERRSVFKNQANIMSAVMIAVVCAVLLNWGSQVVVTIVGLASVHFMFNEYIRKLRRKSSPGMLTRGYGYSM